MRLFLNPRRAAYLRELAKELDCSPSQVRNELRQLSAAGFLRSEWVGRQHRYSANTGHSMFPELSSMVHKALGMDRILERIVGGLGELECAMVIDDYAHGKDHGIIDLVLVGLIDQASLSNLVRKTERHIGRKIRTLCLTRNEFEALRPNLDRRPQLILWHADTGHATSRLPKHYEPAAAGDPNQ